MESRSGREKEGEGTAAHGDLVLALREALRRRGTLGRVRSALRADAFAALNLAKATATAKATGGAGGPVPEGGAKEEEEEEEEEARPEPIPPEETLVLNELVRDYLDFNGYGHTASVLAAEAGGSPPPTGAAGGGPCDALAHSAAVAREIARLDLGLAEVGGARRRGRGRGRGQERRRGGAGAGRSIPLLYGIVGALKANKARGDAAGRDPGPDLPS